ncbi:hypothetical protein ABFX02_06G091100 [Erythranthe guttata]
MEAWFIIVVSLCISALVVSIFNLLPSSRRKRNLPPGPPIFPIIGNLLWLHKPVSHIEYILRRLKTLHGPLITLTMGRRSLIFVGSHSLAHQALVQNGAVFADRPAPPPTSRVLHNNKILKTISSSPYGATWRLLRRNLTQEILHPSRARMYSASRRWVLSLLIRRLADTAQSESSVMLIDHFQYAMFSLLVIMCFGDKLHENQIKEIESIQRRLILGIRRFNILNLLPRLGKILFRNRWNELKQLRQEQEKILIPLIKARLQTKQSKEDDKIEIVSYVDTLMDLKLPEEENRKLQEDEMVSMCSEFLTAGTDTTSTALQWIMANLVKHPQIQERLYQEIISVVGRRTPPQPDTEEEEGEAMVEEEDLRKMPYLKAVVLEGLRRHPPGHFVLPHKTTHDFELDGYTVPKDAVVNFMVADIGWDPNVWEDPMEFKPERFLEGRDGEFDITGSREIKMMPFGAGRRVCPASGLAMLHLEYFVANLIWWFEWKPVEGDEVDLSEKQEFTIVMKNPLRAKISPRKSD